MRPEQARMWLVKLGVEFEWPPNVEGYVTAHCPFHHDERPSFWVNIETESWGCLAASCGKHGEFPGDLIPSDLETGSLGIVDLDPSTQEDRLFRQQYAQLLSSTYSEWCVANERIRQSTIPAQYKDWLWDRLDQFYAALPPRRGVLLEHLVQYRSSWNQELGEIRQTLRGLGRDLRCIDIARTRGYYPRRWKIRQEVSRG